MMTYNTIKENIETFDSLFLAVKLTTELLDKQILSDESLAKLEEVQLDRYDFYEMGIYFLACSNSFRSVIEMEKHPDTDTYFKLKKNLAKATNYLKEIN